MSFFNPSSTGALATGDVLNTISDAIGKARVAASHAKTSSLVDVTAVARVEPLAIIDTDSINTEYVGQVLQCAHNIFTAYYLQAVSLLGDVGAINVIKTLDKLNPNRKPDHSGFLTQIVTDVSTESYSSYKNTDFGLSTECFSLPNYALEANDKDKKDHTVVKYKEPPSPEQYVKLSDAALKTASELSNISFGKLINVTITDQGNTITVPISIRLIANELQSSPMLRLLSLQGLDRTLTERFWKWRAGRIGFIKDLILMRDLVREDKKAMMQDKVGVLDEIMRRARNNKLAGFFSKNASMNEASNVIVISEETARQLKNLHNVDVENYKQRQTIFDGSYAMIIVLIDREYERVTFYISGQSLGSSMSKSELKSNAAKGSGADLVEIFSALKKSDSASLF